MNDIERAKSGSSGRLTLKQLDPRQKTFDGQLLAVVVVDAGTGQLKVFSITSHWPVAAFTDHFRENQRRSHVHIEKEQWIARLREAEMLCAGGLAWPALHVEAVIVSAGMDEPVAGIAIGG